MLHRYQQVFNTAESPDSLSRQIFYLRAPFTGSISRFDVWIGSASASDVIFDIRKNGVAVYSGGSRPIITAGLSTVSKTSQNVTVNRGDIITVEIQGGLPMPMTFEMEIDDGESGGGAANLIELSDVDLDTPEDSQVLTYDETSGKWINANSSSSGEINTASNTGTGAGVFKAKTGVDLAFRKIKAGTGVTITENADDITIDAASSGDTVYNPDKVPSSPDSFDDEFATTIDGGWTQVNNAVSGTTTFSVVDGSAKILQPYQSKIYPSGLQKNVPSGNWTIEFKMKADFTQGGANLGNYSRQAFGVWVNCGTYKYLFGIFMQNQSFARGAIADFTASYSTGSTGVYSTFDGGKENTALKAMMEFQEPKYYRVKYVSSGTVLSFYYSHDRKTWFQCDSRTATPTTLLFGLGNYQYQVATPNPDAAVIFDWIRKTA